MPKRAKKHKRKLDVTHANFCLKYSVSMMFFFILMKVYLLNGDMEMETEKAKIRVEYMKAKKNTLILKLYIQQLSNSKPGSI